MLLALPVAAFFLLWYALAALGVGSKHAEIDRAVPSFLAAAAIWAAFLALTAEALSLVHGITQLGVALTWTAAVLATSFMAWRAAAYRRVGTAFQNWLSTQSSKGYLWPYAVAGGLVGALLVVAWVAPPNNNDSLLYHMSRVAHWEQNASLAHYPTAYNNQLWIQTWAEMTILHFKVLLGSDHASNLVQWFSMVGCLLGVGGTAKLLGARRAGAWLAAAFMFSLPLGILESTSTQTDYVAAFWLITFAYFVVLSRRRALTGLEWVGLTAALSVGVLTKATIYLYAFPLAAWFFLSQFLDGHRVQALVSGVGVGLSIVVLNLGYFVRDIITFGGPMGSAGWTQSRLANNWPGQFLIGPLRQILLNGATPSERVTQALVEAERFVERVLGVAKSPFKLTWAWNNEDFAGNPIHVLLIGVSLLAIIWLHRRARAQQASRVILAYAAVSISAFLLFSWLSSFSDNNVRFQVPAFALFAPLVGVAGDRSLSRRWAWSASAAAGRVFGAMDPLNQSRPLVSWRPRTRVNSIFLESRQRLLFANWPELQRPYVQAADLVRSASCKDIGLVIDSHDKEYLLWSVLGAPENGMRLEVLDPLSASSRYLDPTFEPCAIVCTICGTDRTEWGGLPLADDFGSVKVYLRPDHSSNLKARAWGPISP